MFAAKWELGAAVRVVRNLRNDGTYPGAAVGALLVRRGSVGHVVEIGTFLQDEIIYAVHFLQLGRIVGCRERELIDAAEPWQPSRFEVRERVRATRALAVSGEVLIPIGSVGQVFQVLADGDAPVYHVHFDCQRGRIFAVPEAALAPLDSGDPEDDAGGDPGGQVHDRSLPLRRA